MEEVHRAEEKKSRIAAANRKIWNQSDRVRELHSKMLLSEVLAERQAQMSLSKRLKEIGDAEEAESHARLLQHLQVWLSLSQGSASTSSTHS